jgi:hypothetical protein
MWCSTTVAVPKHCDILSAYPWSSVLILATIRQRLGRRVSYINPDVWYIRAFEPMENMPWNSRAM